MTEYEIASFAQEQIASLRDTTQGIAAILVDTLNLLYTLLFGYLAVAYFVGKTLSSIQVGILNTLYLILMLTHGGAAFSIYSAGKTRWNELLALEKSLHDIPSIWTTSSQIGTSFIIVVMVLASLWFMWNVRHPKTE